MLSTLLGSSGDDELAALVDTVEIVGIGGGSTVVDVGGEPVFAKRIPLTEREWARPRGTANVFGLPMCCQYGIGSPGLNAWRELAANLIVTDGVLAGETTAFPLLYHWRVLPGRPPIPPAYADVDAAVAKLGGGPHVRDRLEALVAAKHSLVLFWEYLPYPLVTWLRDDPASKADTMERQLSQIVTFLRSRDLLHMDGHFGNMRADGDRIYLTDFGLVTSPRFELSDAERDFVRRHATYDAGCAASFLVNWLVTDVCGVTESLAARNEFVRRCADGHLPDGLPPAVTTILARHSPTAATMNDFYWRLFDGDLHAEFPQSLKEW